MAGRATSSTSGLRQPVRARHVTTSTVLGRSWKDITKSTHDSTPAIDRCPRPLSVSSCRLGHAAMVLSYAGGGALGALTVVGLCERLNSSRPR
jgi:hypothetical protein